MIPFNPEVQAFLIEKINAELAAEEAVKQFNAQVNLSRHAVRMSEYEANLVSYW